jgi:hypothetical protein
MRSCATSRSPIRSLVRTVHWIWGTTSSANNDSKEPFAWALSQDNKTIVGADTDGYYRITILSADQIEKCYAQSALGSRQAIVATCFVMNRVK